MSQIVHRYDMGVIETGQQACFIEIGFDTDALGNLLGSWHFDRDRSLQLVVSGEIHAAKGTFTKNLFDPIATNRFRMLTSRLVIRPRLAVGRLIEPIGVDFGLR